MNILSLFDGISCARVALERAGIKVDKYYASEIDKYAIQIAQKNYPDTVQVGSVKNIGTGFYSGIGSDKFLYWFDSEEKIHDTPCTSIDLMIGGSPCQDLSIAGKRKGLGGERSGLFWEYVRLLKEVKPKYFILENVNSMPKEAKQIITDALGVEPIMINASLVSSQNRKRLFWVGKLVGNKYEQVIINQPEDKGILLRDILEPKVDEKFYIKDKSNTVRSSGLGSKFGDKHCWDSIRIGEFNKGGQGDRIYSSNGKSVSLSANGGGRGAKTGLYAVALTETRTEEAKKIRKENMKLGRDWSPRRGKELKPREDNKSNTITTGTTKESLVLIQTPRGKNKGGIKSVNGKTPTLSSSSWEHNNKLLDNGIIRKLTPIECERLMTLPDNYTAYYIDTLTLDKLFSKIKVWNKNVVSKIVRDYLVQKLELVLNITKDTKDIKLLNYQIELLKNVIIVIENQSQEECVINIIKIGKDIKTHSIQIKLDEKQKNLLQLMDINGELLTEMNTEILWKNILGGNYQDMKSSIISILIKLIIELKTYFSVQKKNTHYYIINLKELLDNCTEVEVLNLRKENIKLVSNTQRYKCLGNGFVVEVVAHILKNINEI